MPLSTWHMTAASNWCFSEAAELTDTMHAFVGSQFRLDWLSAVSADCAASTTSAHRSTEQKGQLSPPPLMTPPPHPGLRAYQYDWQVSALCSCHAHAPEKSSFHCDDFKSVLSHLCWTKWICLSWEHLSCLLRGRACGCLWGWDILPLCQRCEMSACSLSPQAVAWA